MATSNTLLTIGMITNEALAVLVNQLTFTRTINRQYSSEFAKTGAKIGDTLNIRKPVRYTTRRTPTLNVQGTTESSVPLVLDTQYGVDMSFTSAELKLSIDDFRDRIIKPAVSQLANSIDYDGLQQYVNIYNAVGTPGTTPSALLTYLSAGVKLDNEAAPMDERRICLNPLAQATIVNALTALFNPQAAISQQYLKGSMGTAVGFEWYMDQNIAMHTFGTYAADVAGGDVTVTTAVTSGTSIVTGGWTAGDALNAGDIITFDGVYAVNPQSYQSTGQLRQFVVTSAATADGAGAMTISVQPALTFSGAYQTVTSASGTLPATTELAAFSASAKVSPQNMAYCRDAFTFANVDLPDMPGVDVARASAPELGMSIRVMSGTDLVNDRRITRLDLLGGWATIRPELAVRIAG